MSDLLNVAAALALWGWGGMDITVVYRDLDWGIAARSTPNYPESCYIEIDPEDRTPRTLEHEVGHCVGRWEHSPDPESIMHRKYAPGQYVRSTDFAAIHLARQQMLDLEPRGVALMVGR